VEVALLAAFWISLGLLAYTHVAYPGLVAVCGRLASRRLNTQADSSTVADHGLPSVTVVIPAHNEEAVIGEKLRNTLQSDYPPEKLDVIVVSDGSSDRTVEIARSLGDSRVTVIQLPERHGKPAAVNHAVARAPGEVLCLCDANVMFQPDAVRRLVRRLEDPRVGAASADVCLASDQSDFGQGEKAYYRLERCVQLGESLIGSMMGVDGGMYVIRRGLYEPVPDDTIVDDFVISMNVIRQGKRVVYEPRAVAHENGTPSAAGEFRRRVRLAAGAAQVLKRAHFPPLNRPMELWQFVSHKLLRWLGPLWLAALLASSAGLAAWSAGNLVYVLVFAAQLAFYSFALVAAFSTRFRRTKLGGVPFYFTMSHIGMAWGFVKGLLNLQPATWERTERGASSRESSRLTMSIPCADVPCRKRKGVMSNDETPNDEKMPNEDARKGYGATSI